jgi:hypothetical protein
MENKAMGVGEGEGLFEDCVRDGARPESLLHPVLVLLDAIQQAYKTLPEAPISQHPAPLLASTLPVLCSVVACSRACASHKAAKRVLKGAFSVRWQYYAACDDAILRKELQTITAFTVSSASGMRRKREFCFCFLCMRVLPRFYGRSCGLLQLSHNLGPQV